MLSLTYAIVCKQVLKNEFDDIPSFIDVKNHFFINKAPSNIPNFIINTFFENQEREKTSLKVRFTMKSPDGDKVGEFITDEMAIESFFAQISVSSVNINKTIEQIGRHIVEIEIKENKNKWKNVGKLPIYIVLPNNDTNK